MLTGSRSFAIEIEALKSRIAQLQERVAELEQVVREIDQDPSQIILTDAQRKILEKGPHDNNLGV